jgi:cyclase
VFHFGTLRVGQVKDAIAAAGHPVRRAVSTFADRAGRL